MHIDIHNDLNNNYAKRCAIHSAYSYISFIILRLRGGVIYPLSTLIPDVSSPDPLTSWNSRRGFVRLLQQLAFESWLYIFKYKLSHIYNSILRCTDRLYNHIARHILFSVITRHVLPNKYAHLLKLDRVSNLMKSWWSYQWGEWL